MNISSCEHSLFLPCMLRNPPTTFYSVLCLYYPVSSTKQEPPLYATSSSHPIPPRPHLTHSRPTLYPCCGTFLDLGNSHFESHNSATYKQVPKDSEWRHHDVPVIQLTLHRYTSAQSILFLSKATCFDQKLVIFRPLQHFQLPDALPTLGSHSVYSCGIHLVKTF